MDDQIRKLDRGTDVLIATPGRLLDLFERGRILLTGVDILVVDEADRMLDMGFIPDVERICTLLPPRRQTLFFSATMAPEIEKLTRSFLRNPTRVEVAPQNRTAETIEQWLMRCGSKPAEKRAALRDQIHAAKNLTNAIIFCNRKRDVATLERSLSRHGFNAGALHGDMDQKARMETLDKFRSNKPDSAGCQRRRRARPRHSRRQPRVQLRRADPCRGLYPPHRSHRSRRPRRRLRSPWPRARTPSISTPSSG